MQQFRTQAIMLRRTNYGEADRVLSLLTPDRGKISAIAKGVRRPKSKLAGGLELFAVCDITLVEGRSKMAVVTSARINHFYRNILHEYERMERGYAFIKQVHRATETVGEPEFYYLLRDALEYLDSKDIDWRLTDLWFAVHLRALLGQGLNMITDVTGTKLAADKTYNYDFSEQGFYEHPSGKFNAQHIKLLRLIMVKTPVILQRVSGVEGILGDCLQLMNNLEA